MNAARFFGLMLALVVLAWSTVVQAGGAAAQTFDTAGLPATPQTFLEQQIRAAIAAYKPGDLFNAALIQDKLAEYYREHGDAARAREAEERAALARRLAGQTAAPNTQSSTPNWGEQAAPHFGEVAAPHFGEAPMPQTGQMSAVPPTGKMTAAPRSSQATSSPSAPAAAPAAKSATASPNCDPFGSAAGATPGPRTTGWQGLYYRMYNGALDKWSFLKNGCFVHEGVVAGAGAAVRGTERGSFLIGPGWIELTIVRSTTGYTTGSVSASNGYTLGAGSHTGVRTLRLPFRLLGKQGSEGMILNHARYKVRFWY